MYLHTGLHDKNGVELLNGCKFHYEEHEDYSLPSFDGEVAWNDEYACFEYIYDGDRRCAFYEHDELQEDFLNHVRVIK